MSRSTRPDHFVKTAGGRGLLVALPVVLFAGLLLALAGHADQLLTAYGTETYALIARNLLDAGLYALDGMWPTAIRPPVYPLFLAGLMALGGASWPWRSAAPPGRCWS